MQQNAQITQLKLTNYLTALDYLKHCHWMAEALTLAAEAGRNGDVPIGAIIINLENQVIAEASNRKQRDQDPTAHAEMLALRQASRRLESQYLQSCVLYSTLEPCPMCTGALIQARIGLLVYGADDPKSGCIRTVTNLPDSDASNHKLSVISGILEKKCQEQLHNWFTQRRHSK